MTSTGVGPAAGAFVIENHDEAYHLWRRAGVKDRVLLHIDAHHDMWWIGDGAPVTIANFICPAIIEGIVNEVVWVVPDATWDAAESRHAALVHVQQIVERYSGTAGIVVDPMRISTQVLGKPLTVCSWASLPAIGRDVLVDIDVDYLVIPRVTYGRQYEDQQRLPWCWPEALVACLQASGIESDLITIAYSVDGGYTPLEWKYLGDELALRLIGGQGTSSTLAGMVLLRRAAVAAAIGDDDGEPLYLHAERCLPLSAAPSFHLARLYADAGRLGEARAKYRQAVTLDPSYRTAFSTAGFPHYWDGDLDAAEKEHRRALDLDSDDPYAHLGLGLIAMQRKRWSTAETCVRHAISIDGSLLDAHRALAELLERRGRRAEAVLPNEAAMRLALAGGRSLRAPILSGHQTGDNATSGTYEDLASEYLQRAFLKALENRCFHARSRV